MCVPDAASTAARGAGAGHAQATNLDAAFEREGILGTYMSLYYFARNITSFLQDQQATFSRVMDAGANLTFTVRGHACMPACHATGLSASSAVLCCPLLPRHRNRWTMSPTTFARA